MINYERVFNDISKTISNIKPTIIYCPKDQISKTVFVNYIYNFFNYNTISKEYQQTTTAFNKMLNTFHKHIIYGDQNTILVDLKIINIQLYTSIYQNNSKKEKIIKNIYFFFNYNKEDDINYLIKNRPDIFNNIIKNINILKLYEKHINIELDLGTLIDLNKANLSLDKL